MSDPSRRNRLDAEASPYLRQHADNPVNWQPWDDAAFTAARERDVPIFLSIGYTACHWCHVMEEESFQDPAVAEVLNDRFVPIKVDREERPDVDSIYQTICQLVSGSGGWPLSVWLTPAGEPFYVGTYFPRSSRHGRPGFLDLLESIATSWASDDRAEMEARATQWTEAIAGEVESVPDQPGDLPADGLASAAQAAVRSADREHGGFGTNGPKFPQPGRLQLLFRAHAAGGRSVFRTVAQEALEAMARGGLFDHLGGGFHRYATDREWTVPHFEKMLYDQAELVRAYLAGHQLTGSASFAAVAAETLEFVERELRHPAGGFYATLDAQSEGEEGAFYVWTPDEVHAAIADDLAATLFCDRYGVTEAGNFEGGRTVLTISESIPALAETHGLSPSAVEDHLASGRAAALAARSDRPRPARDEKVIGAWNGLAISAFAEAGIVLDPAHATTAGAALSFVRDRLWNAEEGRLARRWADGDVSGRGYLEDYAFLGRGALDLYQTTGTVEPLEFALQLGRTIAAEFWDSDAETLYFTPRSGERLVARPQELTDTSTPASAGVAAELLLTLDAFAPDEEFATIAERTLATHADRIAANPLQHVSLALAADTRTTGDLELTVVADELPAAWRRTIGDRYIPRRLISVRPPDDGTLEAWVDRLGVDATPPIWADRTQHDGQPTVYACRAFTCSPPETDLDAALSWASEHLPT